MKHENRIMSDENTDHIGIDSDGYGEWMKSGMRYYRRNRVADLIVMILHGSRFYDDGVGFRRFDFEDFVEELNRHGIYYRGEHFEEVMYEVVNRKMLRDKFNDYLKRKLWIADNTRNMLQFSQKIRKMDKNELIGLLEDLSDYASAHVEWECENCSCRGCPGEENCSRISECTKATNSASKLIEELRIGRNATRTVRKTATRRKGNRHDENKKNKRKK